MELNKELPEVACEAYFQTMFGNVWVQHKLEALLFPGGFTNSTAHADFIKRNEERQRPSTQLEFLAQFFGNSLWEVFSNNHTVFREEDNADFSIGSWRGSGRFIAEFIAKQNPELQFDYMDFYMGHFRDECEAKWSYQFIFKQLKQHGFDWKYEYPQMGIVDFSGNKPAGITTYNPNKALEEEQQKNELFRLIENINEERKNEIQQSPTPTIIIAYGNIFGKYPHGWEA